MEQIYQSIWNDSGQVIGDNAVMVHVRNLRKKIEKDSKIQSILRRLGEKGIMWINRFLEKVGLPKWSLVITGYVVISLLLSFISYVILEESLYSLTSKVVNQSPSYADEMDRINRDIQAYITNYQLSLENAKQLEEWHRAHDDLLILIYQGDELYYDSSLISYGYQESDIMYIPKLMHSNLVTGRLG